MNALSREGVGAAFRIDAMSYYAPESSCCCCCFCVACVSSVVMHYYDFGLRNSNVTSENAVIFIIDNSAVAFNQNTYVCMICVHHGHILVRMIEGK